MVPLDGNDYPWFQENIKAVSQIDPSGIFMDFEDFMQKFGSEPNWLNYESMRKITQSGLDNIFDDTPNYHTSFKAFLKKFKGTAKYRKLEWATAPKIDKLSILESWNNDLSEPLTSELFSKARYTTNYSVMDVKFRYTHFRILQRFIGTNHQHAKYDESVADKCTFCKLNMQVPK